MLIPSHTIKRLLKQPLYNILLDMKEPGLKENEKSAVLKLKEALQGKFHLIDFLIFGSRARGNAAQDSDIDIMIEIEEYNRETVSEIDNMVFVINLAYDCFISTVIFGRKELEEGPLSESPIYKAIEKEGIRL